MAQNMLKYAQIHLKYTPNHPKTTLEQIWSAGSTSYIAQKHLKNAKIHLFREDYSDFTHFPTLDELHNGP
jgi:hypothetical protein